MTALFFLYCLRMWCFFEDLVNIPGKKLTVLRVAWRMHEQRASECSAIGVHSVPTKVGWLVGWLLAAQRASNMQVYCSDGSQFDMQPAIYMCIFQ